MKTGTTLLHLAAWLVLAGCAGFSSAYAVTPKRAMGLCASARETLAKDAGLRNAVTIAFGKKVKYVPANDARQDCMTPVTVLHFADADVLITAHSGPGEAAHSESAQLSAYFLRTADGEPRLVTVKTDFAQGNSGWGDPGEITQTRFGGDDGMIVSGGFTGQGYTYGSASLYVFRDGGIQSLGTISNHFDNGGAEDDASKVVTIDGKLEVGQPQPDRVRVVYTIEDGGKTKTETTVWKSQDGKFELESGTKPEQLN